jgi:chemotaxis protein methyltransferase CheR
MTISPSDFDAIRLLVESRAGIVLEKGKEYLAESRLLPIVERRRLGGLADLVRKLPTDRILEGEVVAALTTNETSFFRDQTPFRFLKAVVLPPLVERVRKGGPPLVVWSAASSSGQEAYSVAMLLLDDFPELAVSARVVGTDLNAEMVDRARAGRYTQLEVNRGLAATSLVKHFTRSGADFLVAPAVKRLVDFRVHNLLEDFRPPAPIDVALCRNVLIYFSLQTRHRILSRMVNALRPDGWLMVGASEAGSVPTPPYRPETHGGVQVFRPTERAR